MKSLKKFAVASMTCAALLGFAATSHAAYQLNDEVKGFSPFPALPNKVKKLLPPCPIKYLCI